MKKVILVTMTFWMALTLKQAKCLAGEWVNGYFRADGSYVQGHYRSTADESVYNNYNTYEPNPSRYYKPKVKYKGDSSKFMKEIIYGQ